MPCLPARLLKVGLWDYILLLILVIFFIYLTIPDIVRPIISKSTGLMLARFVELWLEMIKI